MTPRPQPDALRLDTLNFWLAFSIAAYTKQRDAIFASAIKGEPLDPKNHGPNNWDYTKRIHRKGYGWKKMHES